MRLTAWIAAVSVCFLLGSCRGEDTPAYSEFVAFGSDGWDPICIVGFNPYPNDSLNIKSQRYDLVMTLRYIGKDLTPYVPLEITEENEDGVIATERRIIHLSDSSGTPLGKKGIVLYEISDTLHRAMKIPDGYSISFTTLSPPENTLCLRNLGVSLIAVK